jgi:hypothetical protein
MPVWDKYAIYLTLTDDWVATMPTSGAGNCGRMFAPFPLHALL